MRSKIANEVIFILLVTLGVYFLISLLTHSPLEDPWSGDVILAKPVINAGGIFGAYLSDISISILGYVSYLLPVSLIWLGYNFHRDAAKEKQIQLLFLLRLIAFFVMLVFATALSAQYIAEPSGGYIGVMMHEMFFLEYFGKVSTAVRNVGS